MNDNLIEATGGQHSEQVMQPLALKDYVVLVSDALPADFMRELIDSAEADGAWLPGTIQGVNGVNPDIRACDVVSMDNTVAPSLRSHRDALLRVMLQCGRLYTDRFPKLFGSEVESPQLIRYGVDQFYREHVDHGHGSRKLSLSITLNDDYVGGQISLFQGRLKLSTKAGDVVMFPSNFLFPHSVEPVTEGTRYAAVTWLL